MRMPTFIEVPIQMPHGDTATVWLNLDHITCVGKQPDGHAGVTTTDGSALSLNITFSMFMDILGGLECRLLHTESCIQCWNRTVNKKEDISE